MTLDRGCLVEGARWSNGWGQIEIAAGAGGDDLIAGGGRRHAARPVPASPLPPLAATRARLSKWGGNFQHSR
jgi:hypothetical protein